MLSRVTARNSSSDPCRVFSRDSRRRHDPAAVRQRHLARHLERPREGLGRRLAGAESQRVHINELIRGGKAGSPSRFEDFHILVLGGGFSWADDHGAGPRKALPVAG